MRIIGGEFRGRKLKAPGGIATRPTSDRVRASLFDILAPRIVGTRFLDAFAGTGAVGIEAISRGAHSAVFVESDRAASKALEGNLEALGLLARSRVILQPFDRAIIALGREKTRFDVVYLDPPYGPGEVMRAIRLVESTSTLSKDGLLVAEHDASLVLPDREGVLRLGRARRYGRTCLSFYSAVDSATGSP